jgi:hypothetical protein
MTASEIFETFDPPAGAVRVDAVSLIKKVLLLLRKKHQSRAQSREIDAKYM